MYREYNPAPVIIHRPLFAYGYSLLFVRALYYIEHGWLLWQNYHVPAKANLEFFQDIFPKPLSFK
jgi:hypothetical protein